MDKDLVLEKIIKLENYIKGLLATSANGVEDIHDLRTKSREILSLISVQDKFYYDLKKVLKLSNEIRDIDVFFEQYIPSIPDKYQCKLNLSTIYKIANNTREKNLNELFLYLESLEMPKEVEPTTEHKNENSNNEDSPIEECLLTFNIKQLHKYRIYIKKLMYREKNQIDRNKERIKILTRIKDLLGFINDNYNGLKRLKQFDVDKKVYKQIKAYIKEDSFNYYTEVKYLNQKI